MNTETLPESDPATIVEDLNAIDQLLAEPETTAETSFVIIPSYPPGQPLFETPAEPEPALKRLQK